MINWGIPFLFQNWSCSEANSRHGQTRERTLEETNNIIAINYGPVCFVSLFYKMYENK